MVCLRDRTRNRFLAAALAVVVGALPVAAKPPQKTAPAVKIAPYDVMVAKAAQGKIPAFFDAQHLNRSPALSAASAVLMDADSGQVLWVQNAEVPRPPASTTKILTALLFIEHTRPDDIVTCRDANVPKIEESSLHIKYGERFRAEQLLYGMLLRSGNDAAVVMAEHVSGSVPAFARLMNERAAELGATNSYFVTPNGLNAPGHHSTALDLARIARVAMQNPRFAEAVRLPSRTIERSINFKDTHIVARSSRDFFTKFPGADGVKSGYTRQAKRCYVGSAVRDGRRLISVVLGCNGGAINDTTALLGWGFRRFGRIVAAFQKSPVAPLPVPNSARGTVVGFPARDVSVSVDMTGSFPHVETEVHALPDLAAPIRRGQVIGSIVAKLDNKAVAEVPILAGEDVASTSSPLAAMRHLSGTGGAPGVGGWVAPGVGASALLLVACMYGYKGKQTRKTAKSRVR